MSITVPYDNFSPGMNIRISPVRHGRRIYQDDDAGAGYSILMQNVILDEFGAVRSRRGYKKAITRPLYDSTGFNELSIRYLFPYQMDDGTYELIAQAGDRFVKVDIDNNVFTVLKSGFTEGLEWTATQFDGKMYFACGSGYIQRYDGTTWDDLSGVSNVPEDATIVIAHMNHLFAIKENKAYFSPIGWDGSDDWLVADYLTMEPYTGSLTGAISKGALLMLTTNRSTYAWTFYSRAARQQEQIDKVFGCASHSSMCTMGEESLFGWTSNSGPVMCDGFDVVPIGKAIDPYFRNINKERLNYSVGAYYRGNDAVRDHFMMSFALSDTNKSYEYNNFILCYHVGLNAWTIFTGINADAMATITDEYGKDVMYFGDKNGYVYEYDTGFTDNGTPIDFEWLFKHTWNPSRKYTTNRIYMKYRVINAAELTVNYSDTFDNTSENSVAVSLSGFSPGKILDPVKFAQEDVWLNYGYKQTNFNINTTGRDVLVRLSNSQVGQHIAIHELAFEGNPRGQF